MIQTETLMKKIKGLPMQHQAEVEDFVDFLTQRSDRTLVSVALKASEDAFARVWDNEEDSVYDEL